MRMIGYARVSTKDQNPGLQIDALQEAGCKKIYIDRMSGATEKRPELDKMIESLYPGDTIVIWKLDRLGRSLQHLVKLVNEFQAKQVQLKSLNDPVDTTTPSGTLIFNIFASIAEFEREILKERTMAGLRSARERGRIGGRPKGLSQKAQEKAMVAETLYKIENYPVSAICRQLNISKATLYKYLRSRGIDLKYKK